LATAIDKLCSLSSWFVRCIYFWISSDRPL